MDKEEYTKFLSDIFPSKHMNNKIKLIITQKSKKRKYESDESDGIEESESESPESESHESESEEYSSSESIQDISKNEIINDSNIILEPPINKKHLKNIKIKNYKEFESLISFDNKNNDHNIYFKSIDIEKQDKILKQLRSIQEIHYETPLIFRLFELNIPENTKIVIFYKIKLFNTMSVSSGEYHKLKFWIDTFFSIPFNVNSKLPISIYDGIEKCQEYIQYCKNTLNDSIYGMNDAKLQFMQLISQWINNPESIGSSIALKGPMGTGKTTLLKNGISKVLNREIAFIALGGASDGSFLEGHSYTYEGSTYGKILDILIQCKTSNPIIYFDELDKVSNCPKGDEIIGILTHLTDTTQNSEFHDKYMSEISIDMSKCLFIFSYNDESKVNKILKDRMYVIETSGYNTEDKIVISKDFLIPSIEKTLSLNNKDFVFNDEILKYIIENKTTQEKGVRNLKRNLEIIFNRINLFRFIKDEDKLFNQKIIQNIVYPFHITRDIVDILVETKKSFSHVQYMYL